MSVIEILPIKVRMEKILHAEYLETPLGSMLAIADEKSLYLLEFVERRELDQEVERLRVKMKSKIVSGVTPPIAMIRSELAAYFEGKLTEFKTPLAFLGSPFQMLVWEELKKIPPGETRSYLDLAVALDKPTAFRAIGRANGSNQLAIVIPCHRVINASGALAGYSGGLARKKWLIDFEAGRKPKLT